MKTKESKPKSIKEDAILVASIYCPVCGGRFKVFYKNKYPEFDTRDIECAFCKAPLMVLMSHTRLCKPDTAYIRESFPEYRRYRLVARGNRYKLQEFNMNSIIWEDYIDSETGICLPFFTSDEAERYMAWVVADKTSVIGGYKPLDGMWNYGCSDFPIVEREDGNINIDIVAVSLDKKAGR